MFGDDNQIETVVSLFEDMSSNNLSDIFSFGVVLEVAIEGMLKNNATAMIIEKDALKMRDCFFM